MTEACGDQSTGPSSTISPDVPFNMGIQRLPLAGRNFARPLHGTSGASMKSTKQPAGSSMPPSLMFSSSRVADGWHQAS